MPEDYYTSRAVRSGPSLKAMMLAGLLSFAGGAALIGYLVWDGDLQLGQNNTAPQVAAGPGAAAAPSASTAAPAAIDQHIATLEQRLARLDLQAAAFGGSSVRAESLLVALATRRAIEQGQPLGYLESQLTTRFGAARPDAIKVVIAAAKNPVTLDMLAAQLDDLGPALLGEAHDESSWQKFARTISNLFVVQHSDGAARPAEQRMEQARLLLRSGRIEEAIRQISQLPGSSAANGWIEKARRYAAAQAALAQIEQAALDEPALLKSGEGEMVQQPGLEASSTPPAMETPKP
ncbi:MAG: hypothetical protein ABL914_07950 [Novosphingobium sp.]|uniref:hypothetical protein n=1 Tax=Novosphingobium sp. TaxID=1874826 RepID=UPI0032BBB080